MFEPVWIRRDPDTLAITAISTFERRLLIAGLDPIHGLAYWTEEWMVAADRVGLSVGTILEQINVGLDQALDRPGIDLDVNDVHAHMLDYADQFRVLIAALGLPVDDSDWREAFEETMPGWVFNTVRELFFEGAAVDREQPLG